MNRYGSIYDAAIDYTARGYSVIPTGPDKKPLLPTWKEYQEGAAPKDTLETWFAGGHANVAIVTGQVSGALAVLDIDDVGVADELVPQFRERAPLVRTPRGGLHIYLRETTTSRCGPLKAGLADLKAEGGYVLAPPSRTDRGAYSFLNDLTEPLLVENAHAFSLETLGLDDSEEAQTAAQPSKGDRLADLILGVSEGERNDAAARIAGYLRRQDVEIDISRSLLASYAARCEPPLAEAEVRRVVNGIYERYPAGSSSSFQNEGLSEPRLNLITAVELTSRRLIPQRWAVENILPVGGLAVVGAEPAGLKSWLGLHLARSVAEGRDFLGRFGTEQGPVIYVDEEMGESELQRRLSALSAAQPGQDHDLHLASLQGVNLSKAVWIDNLRSEIERLEAKVVVFDTFVAVQGGDENSAQEVRALFNRLNPIRRDLGCAFVFLHHNRKQGGGGLLQLRGSGDIGAVIDSVLTLTRDQKKDGDGFILAQPKNRTERKMQPLNIKLIDLPDGGVTFAIAEAPSDSQEEHAGDSKKERAQEIILDELQNGERSREDLQRLASNADIAGRTFAEALKDLQQRSEISRRPEGRDAFFALSSSDMEGGVEPSLSEEEIEF